MEEYLIHQFSKKLLQRSVFPRLQNYVLWRQGRPVAAGADNFGPVSVNLDLTSACTNRCDHCIDQSVLNTGQRLDFQFVKDILKDLKKKGLKSVIVIGGGEPTLHPDFEKVIKFIKKLSLQVGIASNGTNIKKIEKVSHLLGKNDWVRLSLDAGTNQTFQKIHRPRLAVTLEGITAQVKKMRRKNAAFQMGYSFLIIGDNKKVNGVPLAKNIGEIALAAALAKKSGFNYLSLKPLIDPAGTRETIISPKNLREIKSEIKKARRLEDKSFKIMESVNLLCFYDKKLAAAMLKQPKTCHMQFFRQVINPEGIFSCSSWRGFGNFKVTDSNRKITDRYFKNFQKGREKVINSLNAKEFCRDIRCYYAPFNCWLEELIKSPKKTKALKPIADLPDFFL